MKVSVDGERLNLSKDMSVTARGWNSPNNSTIIAGDVSPQL
jgi:hypothetical protein